MEPSLNTARSTAAEAQSRASSLESQLREAQAAVQGLSSELAAAQARSADLGGRLGAAEGRLAELSGNLAAREQEVGRGGHAVQGKRLTRCGSSWMEIWLARLTTRERRRRVKIAQTYAERLSPVGLCVAASGRGFKRAEGRSLRTHRQQGVFTRPGTTLIANPAALTRSSSPPPPLPPSPALPPPPQLSSLRTTSSANEAAVEDLTHKNGRMQGLIREMAAQMEVLQVRGVCTAGRDSGRGLGAARGSGGCCGALWTAHRLWIARVVSDIGAAASPIPLQTNLARQTGLVAKLEAALAAAGMQAAEIEDIARSQSLQYK